MYKRGLRPFQEVFYITRQIRDLIEWRGGSLCDLHDFSKVIKSLGDEEILSYLVLNDKSIDSNVITLPHLVGIESILGRWEKQAIENNVDHIGDIKRIKDNYTILNKNSALEKCLVPDNSVSNISFDIYHTSDVIYVVLDNTEESNNLLNKTKLVKDIVKEVVKTYSLYYTYNDVTNTDWFVTYIDQL